MSDFDLKIYVELKFNIGEIWKNTGKPVKTKMLFSNTNKNREFNDFSKYTGKFKQINSQFYKYKNYKIILFFLVNDVPVSDGAKGCERAALIFKCTVEKAPEVSVSNKTRHTL